MISPHAASSGHVIVYPIRPAENLQSLSELEMIEMFVCA